MTTTLLHNVYIGLDVHKETIAIAVADPERAGEIRFWGNINNTPDSVRRTFTNSKINTLRLYSVMRLARVGS